MEKICLGGICDACSQGLTVSTEESVNRRFFGGCLLTTLGICGILKGTILVY